MDLGLAVCRFSKAEVGRHARGGPQGNQPPSSHQGPDAESSGSSTAHSSVQLQGGPDLSGGDAADSPHPRVAGSSGSAVEIHLDHVPEAQDSQEANVTAHSCSLGVLALPPPLLCLLGPPHVHQGWSLIDSSRPSRASWSFLSSPGCPEAPSLLLTSHPPQLGQPTCASSPIGSTIPSASGGTSSSSSIQARATRTSQKHHESRPRHKRHMGDRCFVRVTLAEDSGHKVQSILVTDQDRAPAVIHKVLEEHELAREQPKDYQLVQIISGDGTLQIIDGANVYYAMAPSPDYGFLLLRKTTPWMPSFSRLSKPTKPISSMAPPPGSVPGTPKVHGTREAQGGLVAHGVGRRL
ncbi:ral guanine nucleotide dissociation stimulator-like [Dasypus novemcinctus]|uniref:ral guanine nucleotide dissociation stimulator-like n=1 Tax=Dasypus novemcinctus TaxID=9361 RepID=UPI0039C99CBA